MIAFARAETIAQDRCPARARLLDRIVELNPGAEEAFLDGFTDEELEGYLEHLEASLTPRDAEARWSRRAETPAVTGWRAPQERFDRLW